MSEELKKALLEIRDRINGVERHAGILPDPWLVQLAEVMEKTVVPKKK